MTADEKRARLQQALDVAGNTHTIQDVVAMVKAERAKWWERGDGSVVTEIVEYPRFKTVNLWLVSGDLKDALSLEPDIAEWARDQGCVVATASGRKGFGRAARHLGWMPRGWLFFKPLIMEA